jgi:hypothetical protein
VELLVVITITVVVAALSFGAVSKMVVKAKTNKEAENLRHGSPVHHVCGRPPHDPASMQGPGRRTTAETQRHERRTARNRPRRTYPIKFMKTSLMKHQIPTFLPFAALLAFSSAASGHDDMSKPVITTETRKDDKDKDLLYMFIDGVKVHEEDITKQPLPPVVTPGEPAGFFAPPSDAIVLFDGSEKSFQANWTDTKGNPSQWKVVDGALESVKKAGYIQTKKSFGSCQLHVEWAAPSKVEGNGQGRGNSGVFLMGQYEVQVLDSFENQTYADGQAGALYGRGKPLVNACRKPGEWQSYEIIFHRPVFDEQGKVVRRATFTVFHNGVLVQDHVVLSGGTGWMGPHAASGYKAHPDKLPIALQDHGNPVRFRNVWVRELKDKPL